MAEFNKQTKTPMYFQLKEIIKQKIESNEYKSGQCLPSERELCIEFGISRMTVRQAIGELQNEGFLYKIQGKGTFVSNHKIEQHLAKLTSFSDDMKKRGMTPGSKILTVEIIPANIDIANKLQIGVGDMVILIKRLRLADNEPMSIESSYLNHNMCSKILQYDLDDVSLYDLLKEELDIKFSRAVQSFETVAVCGWESRLLHVSDGALALLMERTTYTAENKPFEYVKSIYRGDRYKFYIELKGE